jgi:predicted Zn-dependent peptidase
MVGIYVGTREENLAACIEICSEQIADLAAGNLKPGELERAQESLKGRIMLSMESTSNRMSRLGKSVISDTELLTFERIFAEIDAVDTEAVSDLAAATLAPELLSASGVGPDEDSFRTAVARANGSLVARAAA